MTEDYRDLNKPLHGVKAIAKYFDRHPNTIHNWIRKYDLPVMKLPGGTYITTPNLLEKWMVTWAQIQKEERESR